MSYYPTSYNRLDDGTQIVRGLAVEVIERDTLYRDEIEVLHEGTVVQLDCRRSTDGYTVLIQTPAGVMSARPDELRRAGAKE